MMQMQQGQMNMNNMNMNNMNNMSAPNPMAAMMGMQPQQMSKPDGGTNNGLDRKNDGVDMPQLKSDPEDVEHQGV